MTLPVAGNLNRRREDYWTLVELWSTSIQNIYQPRGHPTGSSRRGGCDKDMSCILIDGHIFHFASCQFGQKTVGSPLGSIVRSVARYFVCLKLPVHVAAWVDDQIFIMSTLEHGACDGFACGCRLCAEYHCRALEGQRLWRRRR